MSSKPAKPKPLKPRAQQLNELLLSKSKRGGKQASSKTKRVRQKLQKELDDEIH